MAISAKITHYLEKEGYRFDVIIHRKTYTAWDTVQTEKVKPESVAKAVAVKAGKEWLVALVPAHRNVDFKKLRSVVAGERKKQAKKEKDSKKKTALLKAVPALAFASEAWMKQHIPGKVGAVPPFRGLLNADIFADRALLKGSKIYVGSGEYDSSLRLLTKQFIKKERIIPGTFSIKKK